MSRGISISRGNGGPIHIGAADTRPDRPRPSPHTGCVRIDLNADLGELPGSDGLDIDARLLAVVSSVNVACGGHAGTSESMIRVCRGAARRGVSVGAHISYPDPAGFGRRSMAIPPEVLRESLTTQLRDLAVAADRAGTTVSYVKPHGALYNDAARDTQLADIILEVVATADVGVLTLPDRILHRRAVAGGIPAYAEAFADRGYRADGSLVPRREPGALITDEGAVRSRGQALANGRPISDTTGGTLTLAIDSVCLHSDTPGAAALAEQVAAALAEAGIAIRPFVSGGPS